MAKRDNAPVPYTCGKIDEVISAIKSVDWNSSGYWEEKIVIDILETVRHDNDALRKWGNEKHTESHELEEEVSVLNYKIKNLEAEIESLKQELQSV